MHRETFLCMVCPSPTLWLLADDRPGNVNQSLGVAQALGWPFVRKDLLYTRLARLPNVLRGASRIGVTAESAATLAPPWPDIIINAGRRGAAVARWIKKQHPQTFLVQLMWPDAGVDDFDLIAVPTHDRRAPRANLIETVGVPHHLTPTKLAEEAARWQPVFAALPHPILAVLIGGNSPSGVFTAEDGAALARHAAEYVRAHGGSVLATTSRRSAPGVIDAFAAGVADIPHHLYRWRPDTPNPYLGMLALADALLVTGDSLSMCSEACATGKPVWLYAPDHLSGPKHRRFHAMLRENGYAASAGGPFPTPPPAPLNAAVTVAAEVKSRMTKVAP